MYRLFLWPTFMFGGLFQLLFVLLIVALIVRGVTHHHHRDERWLHHDHWQENADPRRIAAMRYAAGRIDRAEFERIMSALDASQPGMQTPPAPPAATPPQA